MPNPNDRDGYFRKDENGKPEEIIPSGPSRFTSRAGRKTTNVSKGAPMKGVSRLPGTEPVELLHAKAYRAKWGGRSLEERGIDSTDPEASDKHYNNSFAVFQRTGALP